MSEEKKFLLEVTNAERIEALENKFDVWRNEANTMITELKEDYKDRAQIQIELGQIISNQQEVLRDFIIQVENHFQDEHNAAEDSIIVEILGDLRKKLDGDSDEKPSTIKMPFTVLLTEEQKEHIQNSILEPLEYGNKKAQREDDYLKEKGIFLSDFYNDCNIVDCPIKEATISYEGNYYCLKHFVGMVQDDRCQKEDLKWLISELYFASKNRNYTKSIEEVKILKERYGIDEGEQRKK